VALHATVLIWLSAVKWVERSPLVAAWSAVFASKGFDRVTLVGSITF